jgi:hypothetical protein
MKDDKFWRNRLTEDELTPLPKSKSPKIVTPDIKDEIERLLKSKHHAEKNDGHRKVG